MAITQYKNERRWVCNKNDIKPIEGVRNGDTLIEINVLTFCCNIF